MGPLLHFSVWNQGKHYVTPLGLTVKMPPGRPPHSSFLLRQVLGGSELVFKQLCMCHPPGFALTRPSAHVGIGREALDGTLFPKETNESVF